MVGLFDLAGGKNLVPPLRCKGQFGSSVDVWRADEQWTNRLVGRRFFARCSGGKRSVGAGEIFCEWRLTCIRQGLQFAR